MALTESLTAQALRELNERLCAVCGSEKDKGKSFCPKCYFSLNGKERRSLYTPFTSGYAEIYDELKTKLKAEAK